MPIPTPRPREKASIARGSVQRFHSASATASLTAGQKVDDPAAADVRAFAAAMGNQLLVVTTGVQQGVGE
jgi:hypothetical protein